MEDNAITVNVPQGKKLDAILEMASALKTLAEALNSSNIDVTIQNCDFTVTQTGIGIQPILEVVQE